MGPAAEGLSWGEDLGGINERSIAAAVHQAHQQLENLAYIDFPWSRYQSAQASGLETLAQHLGQKLKAMLSAAEQANARYVATGYAGHDLDWASQHIGRCRQIGVVFSCLLTTDFKAPSGQEWYPIAMPYPEGIGPAERTSTAYKTLQQIWHCIATKCTPRNSDATLLLPGNQRLWHQLFQPSKQTSNQDKAARLIAEEHCNGRSVIQVIRTLSSNNSSESFELDADNFRLSAGNHQVTSIPNQGLIRYSLNLKHSHRTPLAYRDVALHFKRLRYLELPSSIAITGSPGDHSRGKNSLCISEEPWWDLRTTGGCYDGGTTGYFDGLYDDLPIPYYLAINPLILDRITLRLQQLAEIGADGILQHLQQAKSQYLGIFEFRLGEEKVGALHPSLPKDWDVRPLGGLRTKIGILTQARRLGTNYGKGWGQRGFTGLRRKISVDWHLDKLSLITQTAPRLGMAMENVHQQSYISEKPFDMLCSGVVPITYASPNHTLHRFLEPGSHLNVYGLKIGDTLDRIQQFTPDSSVAASIHKTATKLAKLFSSSSVRNTTLKQVADRCEHWVLHQCRTKAYRCDPVSPQDNGA
jgi:hypothetical protein